MSTSYYDGTKLLNKKDINGKKPALYISTSNRSAGKTTYFSRLLVNRFIKKGEQFCLLYRFKNELDDIPLKFFSEIGPLFFPGIEMKAKKLAKGAIHQLSLNGEICGYAIALNSSDTVKKYSHIFANVQSILFDEFQSETNHYARKEIAKFQSVYGSIARGKGSQSRYVAVYMLSNPVTMLNPYYISLGISERLDNKTKFLRGNGWVLEQGYNDSASKAQQDNAFNKAFATDEYQLYNAEGVYLNDKIAMIEKPPEGSFRYVATLHSPNGDFSVRDYGSIMYIAKGCDASYPFKLAVNPSVHNANTMLLCRYGYFYTALKQAFDSGLMRFQSQQCKRLIFKILSY